MGLFGPDVETVVSGSKVPSSISMPLGVKYISYLNGIAKNYLGTPKIIYTG